MNVALDPRRLALLVALYALTFLVALPPGVCFCELEGGSCCGPALDLRDAGDAAADGACEDACCAPGSISAPRDAARRGRDERPEASPAEGRSVLPAAPPVPLT